MRERTTRHGRIERNRDLSDGVGPREVAFAYGAVLLVPIVLWVVANPVLAVGIGVLVGVAYAMARVGIRLLENRLRARRAA